MQRPTRLSACNVQRDVVVAQELLEGHPVPSKVPEPGQPLDAAVEVDPPHDPVAAEEA